MSDEPYEDNDRDKPMNDFTAATFRFLADVMKEKMIQSPRRDQGIQRLLEVAKLMEENE